MVVVKVVRIKVVMVVVMVVMVGVVLGGPAQSLFGRDDGQRPPRAESGSS